MAMHEERLQDCYPTLLPCLYAVPARATVQSLCVLTVEAHQGLKHSVVQIKLNTASSSADHQTCQESHGSVAQKQRSFFSSNLDPNVTAYRDTALSKPHDIRGCQLRKLGTAEVGFCNRLHVLLLRTIHT